MLEFLAAHPWIACGFMFACALSLSTFVARVIAAVLNGRTRLELARRPRAGSCPRCKGTGWDADELERAAARRAS